MIDLPPFRPHPLLPGGHAQTLATLLGFGPEPPAGEHELLALPDGDALALRHSTPAAWREPDGVGVLVHGLTGDHTSRYMRRIAARLVERGLRVVRVDARCHGDSAPHCRRPSHAGRSADVVAALRHVAARFPSAPLAVAGFSLGGNQVAKALGEAPERVPATLASAVVVNAPLDLHLSIDALECAARGLYDGRFTRNLNDMAARQRRLVTDLDWPVPAQEPRSVREFDALFTAPLGGFRDADDYYTNASAGPHLHRVVVPTLVLSSADDPLVPAATYSRFSVSPSVRVHVAPSGGHLGFLARDRGTDPDRRWMDGRVVDWLTAHLEPRGG